MNACTARPLHGPSAARFVLMRLSRSPGLTYSRVAAPGEAQDSDRYSPGARHPLGNVLALKFGYEFLEVANRDKSRTLALGAEHRLGKRTLFFSEVGRTTSHIRARDDKGVTFMLGMTHRF